MKLMTKLIAWFFGLVLLLCITAGVLLVSMVNSAWMKDEIRYYALQYTGKEITIKGNLQASFYPNLGVKANDVTIANPQGFGGEPLLIAKDIIISAKLAPLFQRKFEINKVILHDATINLHKRANGSTNWQINSKTAEKAASPSTNSQKEFSIAGIELTNTHLFYRDDAANSSYALRDLNLTTDAIKENKPVHVKTDFSYWQQNSLVTHANMNTDLTYSANKNNINLDKLDLTLAFANQPKIHINGAMKLDLAKFALQSQHLHIETHDRSIIGEIAAISLRMPKNGNNIVGTLTANSLQYQKYLLKNLRTQIAYYQKQLTLTDLRAAIFGGSLSGNITANFAGNEPSYLINQKLSNVQLDQLLATLGGKAKLNGLTNLALNLRASGSGAAMKSSLTGSLSISITDGVINGTDLDYKIDQAIIKYTKRAAKVTDSGSTRFTSLNASASVNSGILTTDNLVFLTPKIRVNGDGNINLNNENVDIDLTCRLLNQEDVHTQFLGVKINTDLAMYDIPASVGCKISEPCVSVKLAALLTELAKTQGAKAVEDVVKKGLINKVIKDQKLNESLQKLIPF